MMPPLLDVQHLTVTFERPGAVLTAVNDLTLTIGAGETLGLVGESGSGKSECAFDLMRRGHQLVADDVVEVFERGDNFFGRATDLTRGLMEIRGLGIVDVASVFGEEALCLESSIDLYVEISEAPAVDRFGAVKHEHVLGERRLPKYVFPARAGGGLPSLIEKAVRETADPPADKPNPHKI